MLFPYRKCVWPYWLNSGFQERVISRPMVNAVYLLRCGRIRYQHIFVAGMFLCVGRIGTSIFPGNREWECSELDTLYGKGQMNMCGRNALEH